MILLNLNPRTKAHLKRKATKKKPIGGQKGHKAHKREPYPPEDIDHSHSYELGCCPCCQNSDIVLLEDIEPRVIQQVEIKQIAVHEEHYAHAYWCEACQKKHYAEFPPEILKEGLFKARLTTLVAYMKNVCHASFSTIRKFIRDILEEKVSRGYLAKLIQKVSQALEQPYEELLKRIPLETTLNIDETGHKKNGKRFWTWVFKAELYVLFRIDKSRGSKVLIDTLGKEFEGVIGCDYFSAYRKYMKDFNVTMQFCIAHLIRDIKFLTTHPDESTRIYGKKLLEEVKGLFKIIHQHETMSSTNLKIALEQTKNLIITCATENVPSKLNEKGKETLREAYNMANRFRKHGEEYFTFITTPGMDPTNNTAEQAIRFIVIDRLITQGTRSEKGQRANERLWTVIGTCSMQGRSAFEFILKAVQAYFQNTPSPSLLSVPP